MLNDEGVMDEARMDGPSPHFQNERVELGVSWTPAPSSASWGEDSRRVMVCWGWEWELEERARERAVERPPMPAPTIMISMVLRS